MNLFTRARIKITFLYFLLGIVIASVAGYLMYSDIDAIIAKTVAVFQTILISGMSIDQVTVANVLAQSIDAQAAQMGIVIGLWLIIAMVFSAFLLAGITLAPLKRAMKRQERFMANISHELRTPLAVMRMETEASLLGTDDITREELIESKKSDLEEIDRMSKIVEFLFNFSNIENRMKKVSFGSVDLVSVIKKAVSLMDKRAKEKQISILIETEPAVVPGNAIALEEVIVNLVKNAIAYTPEKGWVKIATTKRYGSTLLSVEDSGVGIPPKDLPNIFEAFYRGENAPKARVSRNSGLGLAIVKEIVLFHDAKISVKSELGKGTKFTIKFPNRISRWFTLVSPWP